MEHIIDWMLHQNIELTILVCLILVVRIAFKKVLAPKAIHLLWLIVLVKSVTYLNVPYVSTKQVEAKSEINNTSSANNTNLEKSFKNETQASVLVENEKPIIENIKLVAPNNEKAIKTEVAPRLFDSTINYFTADKIKSILFWSYLLVLTALLIHLFVSLIRVRSLKMGGASNDLLTNKLQALKTKLKIKSKIEIVESNMIPSPTLIGLRSFTILVPKNILGNISNTNLEDIITHELMHIKRKDTLVNLIFRIVACLYFYNPFIWLAYFTMKKDMESACDQDVLIKSDFKNNISYAESLLLITKLCKQNGQVNHHAMMFIHKNTFKRIDMITNFKKPGVLSKIIFIFLSFALLIFVPSYRLVSEEVRKMPELNKIILTLDNKNNEENVSFLSSQLKPQLNLQNIFINHHRSKNIFIDFDSKPICTNPDLNLKNFNFNGSFEQFKVLILKEQKSNVVYHNNNLYFTNLDEKIFIEEFEKINKLVGVKNSIKNLLNKEIKSITIEKTNYMDAIKKIGKEIGLEIDCTSDCNYSTIIFLKEWKVSGGEYTNITAWDLLISLSCELDHLFSINIKDNKILLTHEGPRVTFIKSELLTKINFEKTTFNFSDIIVMLEKNHPNIIVENFVNDVDPAIELNLSHCKGVLGDFLKEALNQVKIDYAISDNVLIIEAEKQLGERKLMEERNKNKYLADANAKMEFDKNFSGGDSISCMSKYTNEFRQQIKIP